MNVISTNGVALQIDEVDLELVKLGWYVDKGGYAKRYYPFTGLPPSGKQYLHRVIMQASKGEIVDHKNEDKLDNRRSNLRLTNKSVNTINSSKIRGACPYRGVTFNKNRQKYQARITFLGKTLDLGFYEDMAEAGKVYLMKKDELLS